MRLPDLVSSGGQFADPELREHYLSAVKHLLGEPKAERRQRSIILYTLGFIFIVFYIATGVITLLATLKRIEVETQFLTWLWGTFAVESGGITVRIIWEGFSRRAKD